MYLLILDTHHQSANFAKLPWYHNLLSKTWRSSLGSGLSVLCQRYSSTGRNECQPALHNESESTKKRVMAKIRFLSSLELWVSGSVMLSVTSNQSLVITDVSSQGYAPHHTPQKSMSCPALRKLANPAGRGGAKLIWTCTYVKIQRLYNKKIQRLYNKKTISPRPL